jgi:hypothetical protein
VKSFAKTIAVSLAFLVGVGVGIGAYRIHVLDQAAAESKVRWLICTKPHQSALCERAGLYRQKLGRWPTSVQELVEAHFLPEYSEVHLCPSQVAGSTRADYQGSDFVDQNHAGFVAYYTSSPYRFRVEGSKFTVICDFDKKHTQ